MSKTIKAPPLTKQQFAHEYLHRAILSGELKPGERVVIDRVARELGVSAIPIREAITQLDREGLVTIRPHAGAMVSDIPEQAIEEIFALLETLELAAARLALPKVNAAVVEEMTSLCEAMESTTDPLDWAKLNRDFHETLPRAAELERITEMLVKVGQDWERLRKLRFAELSAENAELSNTEHRKFVTLIESQRLGPVEDWIREHNRDALHRYLGT